MEKISKPQGELDDCQGWIGMSTGPKDRAASNIQILDSMDLTIAIHDRVGRIASHPGSAHVVPPPDLIIRGKGNVLVEEWSSGHSTDILGDEVLSEGLGTYSWRPTVLIGFCPID